LSFGIAQLTDDDTKKTLFEKADGALYEAKNNGRNRVEVYNS
jgi:PleD family two-component response regulator